MLQRYLLTFNEKSKHKIIISLILIIFYTCIIYSFYSDKNHWYDSDTSNTNNLTFFECLYVVFLSFFTLGYGNLIPKSNGMKTIVMFIMLSAFSIILF
jgi:hypothetical protein